MGMPSHNGRILRLLIGCALAAAPCARAALPLEVYGRLPRLENLALSPDGARIAFVPFEQSKTMYEALRSANQDAQLITLKEEDHWLSRSTTRLQMLETAVAFLRAHNPPDAPAAH
jgi:hypothetical protein